MPLVAASCMHLLSDGPLRLNWAGAFDKAGRITEAQLFARASVSSSSRQLVSPETQAAASTFGIFLRLNDRAGAVYAMQNSRPFFILPLDEPVSSIEFFRSGPELGFLVVVGWTRVRYFVYADSRFSETDVREFHLANRFMQPKGINFNPLRVRREDYDDLSVADGFGNLKYLNSKQLKNLLQELELNSEDELPFFHFTTNLDLPGRHQLDLYLELNRLSQMEPAKLGDIYTVSAQAVAELRTPDFRAFFSPLVSVAFDSAFRGPWRHRFTAQFAGVVEAASGFRLRRIPLLDDDFKRTDEPVVRFRAENGREYLLLYSLSFFQPLRLERIDSFSKNISL